MSKITNRLAFFAKIKKRSDDLVQLLPIPLGKVDNSGTISPDNIDRQDFPERRQPYATERYSAEISNSVNFLNPAMQNIVTDEHVKVRAQKVAAGHLGGESKWFINEVMVENHYVRGYSLMIKGWTGKGSVTRKVQVEGSWVINDGPYEYGTEVQVEFIPAAGYRFASWSDGGLNPHTVTMNDDVVLTVSAEQIPVYTLAFSASGTGTLTATAAGNAITSPAQLEAGVAVVLTATPGEGYMFDSWSGLPEGATTTSTTASFSMPAAAVNAGVNFVEAPSFQGLKLTNVETVTSITAGGTVYPFYAVVQGDHYFQWGDSSHPICTDKRNPAVGDSAYDGGGTSYTITAVTTSSENTLGFTFDYSTGFESMSYSLNDGATFDSWPTDPGVGAMAISNISEQYNGDYVYAGPFNEMYGWVNVNNMDLYVDTYTRNPAVGDIVQLRSSGMEYHAVSSVTSGCVESLEIASASGITYWFTDVQSGSNPFRWTAEDADPIYTAVRHPSIETSVYSSSSSETPSSTVTATTQETTLASVTYTGSICLKGKSNVWTAAFARNSFKSSICVNASGRLSSIISDTDTPQELEEMSLVCVFGTMIPGTFPGVLVVDASGLVLDDTLGSGSYGAMFANNVTLTTAPALPVTTLTPYCYSNMFGGCISLVTAPSVLPALALPDACYRQMFQGCTSLVNAPEISATSFVLAEVPTSENYYSCFQMFYGCTSLVTAPSHLYPEEVPFGSYGSMFAGCTSLVTAPTIHAVSAIHNEEEIGNGSFQTMFSGCTSLVNPPIFSSLTTVDKYCCAEMFQDCTSLISTPVLPALTLKEGCYQNMFDGCSSLKDITCLATDITASSCTDQWVTGVAATGIFHRNPDTWAGWTTGEGGIPAGWTIDPEYIDTRLKFVSSGTNTIYSSTGSVRSFSYSLDDGATWNSLPNSSGSAVSFGTSGILIKGTNTTPGYGCTLVFDGSGNVTASGDITCLINDGVGGINDLSTNPNAFRSIFRSQTKLVDVSGLILPSLTLGDNCYQEMFRGCTNITVAPTLPAPILASSCYYDMFNGCSNLNEVHCMAINHSAQNCTNTWLQNVAGTGNFYGKTAASWPTGASGIPEGWTAHLD